jgi:hypothetical protein
MKMRNVVSWKYFCKKMHDSAKLANKLSLKLVKQFVNSIGARNLIQPMDLELSPHFGTITDLQTMVVL